MQTYTKLFFSYLKRSLLVLLILFPLAVFAQPTVGVLSKTDGVTEGYNLIFPHNQGKVFLLDNDGQLVHYWDEEPGMVPGNSVYLLPNGKLLKCKKWNRRDDPIYAPGAGETVELISWDGVVEKSFTLNNDTARLHHDIAPLPNGNVLMIAWEKFDEAASLAAGRTPESLPEGNVLSEMILEWNPETDEIVWSWHVWDHLIQDQFLDKDNYGVVADNPGKIDINYDEHNGNPDWLHINSVSYNPVLDQIALSVPHFNEVWIIDHSTTTAEAKTGTGGRSGKGGRLLHRFGNDQTYLENPNEQLLYFQHDAYWVNPLATEGSPEYGKIALFNNRMPDTTSIGMVIATIDPETNTYYNPADSPESQVEARFVHPNKSAEAYSRGLSNMQVLEGGNVLMFSGRHGYAYELNPEGALVWEYKVPLKGGGTVEQGTVLTAPQNITFRMNRYPLDYEGFEGKDLSPLGLLEEMGFPPGTGIIDSGNVTSLENPIEAFPVEVYPNPFREQLRVKRKANAVASGWLKLYTLDGKCVKQWQLSRQSERTFETADLLPGVYFLQTEGKTVRLLKY